MSETLQIGLVVFVLGGIQLLIVIFKPEWLAKGRKGRRMVGWIGMKATRVVSALAGLVLLIGGIVAILVGFMQ